MPPLGTPGPCALVALLIADYPLCDARKCADVAAVLGASLRGRRWVRSVLVETAGGAQNIIICPLARSTGSLASCSAKVSRVSTGISASVRHRRNFARR